MKIVYLGHRYGSAVVVQKDAALNEETVAAVKERGKQLLADLEADFDQRKDDAELLANAAAQQRRDAAFTEKQPLDERARDVRTQVVSEYQAKIQELVLKNVMMDRDEAVPPQYRALVEDYYRALSEDLR